MSLEQWIAATTGATAFLLGIEIAITYLAYRHALTESGARNPITIGAARSVRLLYPIVWERWAQGDKYIEDSNVRVFSLFVHNRSSVDQTLMLDPDYDLRVLLPLGYSTKIGHPRHLWVLDAAGDVKIPAHTAGNVMIKIVCDAWKPLNSYGSQHLIRVGFQTETGYKTKFTGFVWVTAFKGPDTFTPGGANRRPKSPGLDI